MRKLNEVPGFAEWKNPSPVRRLTDTLSPGRGLLFLVRIEVRKTALTLGESALIFGAR